MTEKQMPCPCTGIAQDESCPVGTPSPLCQVCNGIGRVPAVKLDGSELWEIAFGIANDAAHEITDEQYQQIADAINHVFIDPAPQANLMGAWLPIEQADKGIAYIHALGPIQVGNSYPIWARDVDGRVFECLWADDGKRAYWWDSEAESPVDPVEFMPHPLDPRFIATTEVQP